MRYVASDLHLHSLLKSLYGNLGINGLRAELLLEAFQGGSCVAVLLCSCIGSFLYYYLFCHCLFLNSSSFVCVEVLRPSQPNGVMSSAVSLLNNTFTGQA